VIEKPPCRMASELKGISNMEPVQKLWNFERNRYLPTPPSPLAVGSAGPGEARARFKTAGQKGTSIPLTLFCLSLCLAPSIQASIDSDPFESPSINSAFWTKTGTGTATITNAIAHSGKQSLKLENVVTLTHTFAGEQTGEVSIWIHSALCCSASADVEVVRSNGDWSNIQELSAGNFQARVSIGGAQISTFFSGSAATWHLFSVLADSSGVSVKLDGVTVLTDPRLTTFSTVNLDVWGSSSGPIADYDDFTAVTTPAVNDGFEGPLSAFWTKTGTGTATISKAFAHSGWQSIELENVATLEHAFGAEQAGEVSVWVHSALCCSASADLQVVRSNGDWSNIQELSAGNFQARVSIGGAQISTFFNGSSTTWHLFAIFVGPGGVSVKLDGVTVLTDPRLTTFSQVNLDSWGSSSGPVVFYDDFSAIL